MLSQKVPLGTSNGEDHKMWAIDCLGFQEEHQNADMDSQGNKADDYNFCRTDTRSSHLGFSVKTLADTLYQFLSAYFKVN